MYIYIYTEPSAYSISNPVGFRFRGIFSREIFYLFIIVISHFNFLNRRDFFFMLYRYNMKEFLHILGEFLDIEKKNIPVFGNYNFEPALKNPI